MVRYETDDSPISVAFGWDDSFGGAFLSVYDSRLTWNSTASDEVNAISHKVGVKDGGGSYFDLHTGHTGFGFKVSESALHSYLLRYGVPRKNADALFALRSAARVPDICFMSKQQYRTTSGINAIPDKAKAEQAKAEQAKTEQAKAEQAKAEQAKAEQAKAEQAKAEQAKAEKAKNEQLKCEQAKADQTKTKQVKTHLSLRKKTLDDRCLMCCAVTTKTCGKCHLVNYCGAECQTRDWHVHKLICNSLPYPIKKRTDGKSAYGLLMRESAARAEFVELRVVTSMINNMEDLVEHCIIDEYIAAPHGLMTVPYNPLNQKRTMHDYLYFFTKDDFGYDGVSKTNQLVKSLTNNCADQFDWRGAMLIIKSNNETNTVKDMEMKDFVDVADYLKYYSR